MQIHETRFNAPAFATLPRPQPVAIAGKKVLVLGLGDSGLSVARWVSREGGAARVADTRERPPRLAALGEVAGAEARCGTFSPHLLDGMDLVCVSPGLSLEEPVVREAVARGLPVVGDVEIFAWAIARKGRGKVLSITGTNGKTTVTSLTGHLLRGAGFDAEVAGNISPPVLDALSARIDAGRLPEVWVLELSSYQLETTWSLAPDAAAMLNLSEDHLDRYPAFEAYGAAKARVFEGAALQVLNRDDPHSLAMAVRGRRRITFGLDAPPGDADFGCVSVKGATWIAQGRNPLIAVEALPIHGWHNAANAMAALALAHSVGAIFAPLVDALVAFRGLPHRLEKVATIDGVDYYDDSKGTNVGATIAALHGLARRVVLIAGGAGKGQDFTPLAAAIAKYARKVLLIGTDAQLIAAALKPAGVSIEFSRSLEEAVSVAAREARPGDAVLLSPACASFDMFRDYRHRGEVFTRAVQAREAKNG